jgi:preprotein translocase subunit SecB
VSELVAKGGFPPFLLPLVTFEALHARAAQQAANQPTAPAPASVN